jgi:hypothetical protein
MVKDEGDSRSELLRINHGGEEINEQEDGNDAKDKSSHKLDSRCLRFSQCGSDDAAPMGVRD